MENVKLPKNSRVFSNTNFRKATTKLNQYNLTDLWLSSSLLSSIEYFDGFDNEFHFLFPLLHAEKICMLNKAILASSSRDYKKIPFSSKYLGYIINSLSDAAYTGELTDETLNVNDRVLNYFSKRAITQFQFQNYNIQLYLARAYALYYFFPEKYKSELYAKHKRNFVDIPHVFHSEFGITIVDYLLISFILITFYMQKYHTEFRLNDETRFEIEEYRKKKNGLTNFLSKILTSIIDTSTSIRQHLIFSPENLLLKDKDLITIDKIQRFLELTSKSSKDLSKLSFEYDYQKGEIVDRLCPLQRYPIIKISDSQYVIPNFRYFDISITGIIHYIFQDLFPNNEFNETFGSIFEIYVRSFIENRLNDLEIIPEIRYKKSKNYVDGPDVTVIDKKNNSIIAIEIKSKYLSLDTRLSPMSEHFIKDLKRATDALEKLPTKIDDLYFGYSEYSHWQEQINEIPKENSICFIVIGQGIYFIPEILNKFKENDEEYFLNSFPYKYGVIHLENLEIALELANEGKADFYDLLKMYWQSSLETSPKVASAEQFGGLTSDSKNIYLKEYENMLFKEIGIESI